MLPSAKNYLQKGGLAPRSAGFVLIGCFLAGVVGIQFVSGFLHKFIPSHVVDCDHTHEEECKEDHSDDFHEAADLYSHRDHHSAPQFSSPSYPSDRSESAMISTETSPLILRNQDNANMPHSPRGTTSENLPFSNALGARRPPLHSRITSGVVHLVVPESSCEDFNGPCYGFSDPCGQECFKHIHSNSAIDRRSSVMSARFRPIYFRRRTSTPRSQGTYPPLLGDLDEEEPTTNSRLSVGRSRSLEIQKTRPNHIRHSSHGSMSSELNIEEGIAHAHTDPAHHHHVPENAFLSIGLQTSIAIALHKLPEGFITYATNHANSQLGFAVFMALFIHNITEGFAMALPLFLALGSRWKAMLWSSLLGGISQPLGAGVAAIWFKLAGKGDMAPGERIYGVMFAVTCEFNKVLLTSSNVR